MAEKKFQSKLWFRALYDAFALTEKGELEESFMKKIKSAQDYWDSAVEDAAPHLTVKGELTTLLAETPGLMFFYKNLATDAQQTRKWLDVQFESLYAQKYQWYQQDPEAKAEYGKVGPTDAKQYVLSEDVMGNLQDSIRIVAKCQHGLEDVVAGFEQRGMSLSKIADLRVAGIEETWVEPKVTR